MQFKLTRARSGHAQKAGIQILQLAGRGAYALGDQAQVHRIIDGDGVVIRGPLHRYIL